MNSSTTPTDSKALSPDYTPDEDGCVVWHCRQLRTEDHPALEYAQREYEHILPLFIFDPSFYREDGLACDARIQFMHESLRDLSNQYADRGGELTFTHGAPTTILRSLFNSGWDIIATADPTGRYGLRRDNRVADTCDVTFIDADGIVRETENSRKNWSEQAEAWLTSEQCTFEDEKITLDKIETPVTIDQIETTYDISPDKTVHKTGGTQAARTTLKTFAKNISEYPGSISAPSKARTGTSQLSPYLRFGCLSVRQVCQFIDEKCHDGRAKEMFISRLYWNRHYNQKLADWHGWMDKAVNPVMEDFHADTHDPNLIKAWKTGNTGYPMVDASMRSLSESGCLNFRMRAMCASFLCDLLQQPWKIGADHFYYHLIDADPAINYTQFQIQAGVDGTNMMRIYNPRKQVRDNDPDGEFIKKWVPELEPLPANHLDQPEKTPIHVQKNSGVSIGDNYPYPVVEYKAARERILNKFESIKPKAKKALQHPEVARRASLSGQGNIEDANSSEDIPEATENTN